MNNGVSGGSADFEALYQQAPCGLLSFSIDGTIIGANQTLLKWLGLPLSRIVGSRFTDLLDRGGKLYYQLFVQPLLRLHDEVKEISFEIRSGDNSFPCLFSASVCPDSIENEAGIVHAAIFKVMDRKKYEHELLKRKTRAEEEKQQKVNALEDVAFYQSHLVRAPLANILGVISLFDKSRLDKDSLFLMSMLEDSTQQLDEAIRKIVDRANE